MEKAAQILQTHKDKILETWMQKIQKEVRAAKQNNQLALRDHLPHLLEDIVNIMQRYKEFDVLRQETTYMEIFENSIEHGRHRATSSGYTVEQILREYIVFHHTITDLLVEEEAYNDEVGVVLKFSIENAMLYSGGAFTESLHEMRQKLLGIVAHDIRNPLSAAYLAVDSLEYNAGRDRFEKLRKLAHSSLKRSMELVEGLLDSITVEAGEGITLEFTEANIVENLKSVHAEATEIYTNEMILQCSEQEILGIFDPTMLRRVLENFISNAVKYGNRDKAVTIIVENSQEFLDIKVHNYGREIPPERQEEIFQFLKTTQGSSGKTGLKSRGMGLSLVKAVAGAHGGDVKLESSRETGTTFGIIINKFANKPGKLKTSINYDFATG
ncbi:MAG TPA: sensor histidine kinase [Gillisia sp.]|nr:sensor histidine kinase [Gillisia sp.]